MRKHQEYGKMAKENSSYGGRWRGSDWWWGFKKKKVTQPLGPFDPKNCFFSAHAQKHISAHSSWLYGSIHQIFELLGLISWHESYIKYQTNPTDRFLKWKGQTKVQPSTDFVLLEYMINASYWSFVMSVHPKMFGLIYTSVNVSFWPFCIEIHHKQLG